MKVTVCVPVYNVEKYIRRCLESVVNQTYKDLEIIVVNDCTPDNSMKIVEEIANGDKRFRIIEHDNNRGLMMTRKTGYLAATGDYILFLDSDDTLPEDSIERLCYAQKKHNADIVKGCLLVKGSSGKEWVLNKSELILYNSKEDIFKSLLEGKITHNLAGCLFKKGILHDPDIMSIDKMTNSEDAFLFYQLINKLNNCLLTIPDIVYNYYVNFTSSTHTTLSDDALRKMITVQKYKVFLSEQYPNITHVFIHAVVRYLLFLTLMSGKNKINRLAKEEGVTLYISTKYRLKYLNLKDYVDVIKYFISSRITRIVSK